MSFDLYSRHQEALNEQGLVEARRRQLSAWKRIMRNIAGVGLIVFACGLVYFGTIGWRIFNDGLPILIYAVALLPFSVGCFLVRLKR